MCDVTISKKNEVYIKLECEPHILYELQPYFTFEVPSAKFSPAYKKKYWDGKIYLLSVQTGEIYAGLLDKVIEKLKAHNYTYKFQDNKYYGSPFDINELINPEGVKDYMNSICSHNPREYQISGVTEALKFNRKILLSPTGSGKSLMIYSLVRYYVEKGEKILIIVPTTSLVSQIYKDFIDYGWDAETYCHKIYAGAEKTTDFPVTISTWQAIYKLDKSYFDGFNCIIGDECHSFRAKSLIGIMTKLHNAKYRFGFTGTLDGTETHKWVLEGLFGPSYKITKTDELMQQGVLSKLDIQCIVVKHPTQNFNTYEDEIQYLISNDKRNKFISKLALSLKGNTLILFSRVETHGAILYEKINSSKNGNRKVFFVHGGVDTEEREMVREITERENDAIIVASYGVFSTGINIKMLHNIIFASPSKSRVRNLQSIGRALRVGKNKNKAMLYDIADDCSYKARKNYTLNHFIERVKLYNEENFNYQISNITITGE